MRPILSVCFPYHNQPAMLAVQQDHYRNIPKWVADEIEVVVCDDASDKPARHDMKARVDTRIFRIDPPHVQWSHRCATNICAHHATGEWLLLTDIDHVIENKTLQYLVVGLSAFDPDKVYTFRRRNWVGQYVKPHPDTWLIHRSMWKKIGGWDERYRGLYGQNARIWDRVRHHAGEPVPTLYDVVLYTRDIVPDASSPPEMYDNRPADKTEIDRLRREFRRAGTYFDSHQLTVPYSEVMP